MGEALNPREKEFERKLEAWQDKEKAKSTNKVERMLSDTKTWEQNKKITHDANIQKVEAKLERIRQHEYEKLKNKEAYVKQAVEKKKAAIDAQSQKKTLKITEKADKHRATSTLPTKCFGICTD